jgi:hypothetical protein
MATWLLCLLAGLAMLSQDITLTLMVICENRHRAAMAGALDSVGFLLQVTTYGVSIGAIITNGFVARTYWVLAALTVANFTGTGLGTLLGDRWIHSETLPTRGT